MLSEFRAFVARGNVLDLAVAVIIGAAFATITTSLTDDVVMPIVGALFGQPDFSSWFILLGPVPEGYAGSTANYAELKAAGAPVLGYGRFVTVLVDFLILAFIIFLLVRWANRLRPKEEAGPAPDPAEVVLLREIRDALGKRP